MYIIILHVNISPKARFDQNLCMKSIAEQMLNRNLKTIIFSGDFRNRFRDSLFC